MSGQFDVVCQPDQRSSGGAATGTPDRAMGGSPHDVEVDGNVGSDQSMPPAAWLEVAWRVRRELRITLDQRFRGKDPERARWVVFDPLTRSAARVGYLEHWLLARLDGRRTLAELSKEFAASHHGLDDGMHRCVAAFWSLNQAGWVRPAGASATADRLGNEDRCRHSAQSIWLRSVSSIQAVLRLLVFRVRGINPDRWLARITPQTNWLYSAAAVRFWAIAAAATLGLLALDFVRLTTQLASWEWLTAPQNTVRFVLVMLVTRAVHEFGHGVVCKRWGSRCPDIGLLLVLGAPCVYCDVHDSWQLGNRRARAAIAAAGMYTELIVATLAAWFWLLTAEGNANTLALQILIVCSVSTVAINLNPLMRFDGYHLLSDLLDVGNLRARADATRNQLLRIILLGEACRWTDVRRSLPWVGFSVASWAYRCLVIIAMAAAVAIIGEKWHMLWMGRGIAALLVLTWVVLPVIQGVGRTMQAARSIGQQIRAALITAISLGGILLVPLPARRVATGWIQPEQCVGVYAPMDGRLAGRVAESGHEVDAGTILIQLENPALEVERIERERDVAIARSRLQMARAMRDRHAGDVDLDKYRAALSAAESLLSSTQRQIRELTLRAPAEGIFFRAVDWTSATSTGGSLRHVVHRWGESTDVGRIVPRGTLLGVVASGPPIVIVPLSQSQLTDIAVGTPLRIGLGTGGQVCMGRVAAIGPVEELAGVWPAAFRQPRFSRGGVFSDGGDGASSNVLSTSISHGNELGSFSRFAALCRFSGQQDSGAEAALELPSETVSVVFHIPPKSLWQRFVNWMNENGRFLAQ